MNEYKNDIVLFAEKTLNIKLYEYQRILLRKMQEAHKKDQLFICFPLRHGKTLYKKIVQDFNKN